MLRVALLIGLIVALGVAIRSSGVLEELGLVGSCHAVSTPAGTGLGWQACRAGQLDGKPDLSRRGCVSQGEVGAVEYWLCRSPGHTA